jgi:hypothetical protein
MTALKSLHTVQSNSYYSNKDFYMKFIRAFTLTIFVYGFSGWIYIAENAVFHPQTLSMPLTHFLSWPREDTFGAICFLVSALALFVFLLIRE